MRCFVKVDATALKDYTLVDIDARTDIISLSCGLRGRRSGASDNPVIIGQVAALTNAINSWGEEFKPMPLGAELAASPVLSVTPGDAHTRLRFPKKQNSAGDGGEP